MCVLKYGQITLVVTVCIYIGMGGFYFYVFNGLNLIIQNVRPSISSV